MPYIELAIFTYDSSIDPFWRASPQIVLHLRLSSYRAFNLSLTLTCEGYRPVEEAERDEALLYGLFLSLCTELHVI